MYSMHPQTVRKWIKIGLGTIDSKKPSLIHGSDLKKFLKKHNEKLKKHLDFEEFFCVTCKEAHIPLFRKVYLEQNHQFIKAKGICPITRKIMNRSYKLAFSQVGFIFVVPLLYNRVSRNNKTVDQIAESDHIIKIEEIFSNFLALIVRSINCVICSWFIGIN